MSRQLLRRIGPGLLAVPLALGSSALSCEGPHASGVVGVFEDGERLGVVVSQDRWAGGLYASWSEQGDRVLSGDISLMWTTDGQTFTAPEPVLSVPTDSPYARGDALPAAADMTAWGDCIERHCAPGELWSATDEPWDGPVGRWRTRLVTGLPVACDSGEGDGVIATAVLPGTGQLVAAMGEDGLAIRDADGSWERIAVGGWEPTALTLLDGPGVLVRLASDGVPALVGAAIALWLLALVSRLRARAVGAAAAAAGAARAGADAAVADEGHRRRWPWSLVVAPLLTLPVALYVGLIGALAGGPVHAVLGMLAVVGAGAVAGALIATRQLSAVTRRTNRRVALQGAGLGLGLATMWLIGAPGPVHPWLVASFVAPLGLVVRHLAGGRVHRLGTSLEQENGATASN